MPINDYKTYVSLSNIFLFMNNFQKFQHQQIQGLGKIKGGTITIKPHNLVSQDLQDWWRACRDGQYDLSRDISIILNDNAGNEIIISG
ncbi:hypothetical protein BKI52_35710 [marine bacterium AO1-C]|nr:hypothetical protein BKI52_35710 [marine bacterium AO1-C]